jgi:hypothetical protein
MVTFKCEQNGGVWDRIVVFYADGCCDLVEQICEYQEELEETSNLIVIYKEVKQV